MSKLKDSLEYALIIGSSIFLLSAAVYYFGPAPAPVYHPQPCGPGPCTPGGPCCPDPVIPVKPVVMPVVTPIVPVVIPPVPDKPDKPCPCPGPCPKPKHEEDKTNA